MFVRGLSAQLCALGLSIFCLAAPAALAQCYVWSWFEPRDLQVDHGETATAGVWITGPGYQNVTGATFTWYNPYGVVARTNNASMTSEAAAKWASDAFTPAAFDGYWRVLIFYHSPDLPGGYEAAPPLQFYYGVPPPPTTILATTAADTTAPTPTGTTPTFIILQPTTAPSMVTITLQTSVTTTTAPTTTVPATTATPGSAVSMGLLALACAAVLLRSRR